MEYTYEQAISAVAGVDFGNKMMCLNGTKGENDSYVLGMIHMVANVYDVSLFKVKEDVKKQLDEYMTAK